VSVKNVPSSEISNFRLLFKTSGESKSANPTHEPFTMANVNLSVNLAAFHSSAVANFSEQPNGANSYALALNRETEAIDIRYLPRAFAKYPNTNFPY